MSMMRLLRSIFPKDNSSTVLRIAAIFSIGLALGVGAMLLLRSDLGGDSNENATDTADSSGAEPARRSIVALGTLEPRDGVVQIGSALTGYQIKQVLVQDGQLVKAGDLLIELDASPAKTEHELARSQ